MASLGKSACVVAAVGGGMFIANELDLFKPPLCFREPGLENCAPDITMPQWAAGVLDGIGRVADQGHDPVYTSNVGGGTVKIMTSEEDWPLFDKLVRLEPFDIMKDGKLAYSAKSINRVSTSMIGRVVSITFPSETGGQPEAYVMAVDDKGTPDKTDDKLVPINVNNFKMVSKIEMPVTTYPVEQEEDYDACVASVIAEDRENGGCILSGIDGHNTPIDATIINNLNEQYLGDDQDVVDSLKVASNVVLGHKEPMQWRTEFPETIRTSQIDKVSLQKRMSIVLNLSQEHVHVIMADETVDGVVKPIEWDTTGRGVDLTQVEKLSKGKYESKDVQVSTFGAFQGSWQNDADPAKHIPALEKIMGKEILDPKWLAQWAYKHEDYPAEIDQMTSDKDGKFDTPSTVAGQPSNNIIGG